MGINETGVSRRSFITGAAAAGVLATLGLAGCAPQDKQTASAATSGADTKWDEECDVLVVGSGYTGLAAALEAKNAGADVKVISIARTDKEEEDETAEEAAESTETAETVTDTPATTGEE